MEPLHEKAFNSLCRALRSGRFKPGDAMTIRGLGKELGISATPVREALQRLIVAQALQLQPNRTIMVPRLTRSRFQELTKIRLRLEGLAAQEATPNLTSAHLGELRSHHAAMGIAIEQRQFSDYLTSNEKFHFTFYNAANMPFLRQMIELSWLQIGPWLNALASEGRFHATANTMHTDMLEMANARDAEGVRDALHRDILETGRILVEFLEVESTLGGVG
jgi:DNA-binding GntR family transcriptional regulator